MPVGCLGVSGSAADSSLYLSVEAGKQVERIEVMQSRLLIQIFRVQETGQVESLTCPACYPHTEACCQLVPGWRVMADLVRANTEAVWNMALVKAVNTLTYQVRLRTLHKSAARKERVMSIVVTGLPLPGLSGHQD